MKDNYFAVIMAGGGGTRLWPLSHKGKPKQLLTLGEDLSLFQQAVDRLQGVFPPERILVVTVREQADLLQEQRSDIPSENYLIEPMPRGTASVVGFAAMALKQRNPNAVMAVLTADHIIKNEDKFRHLLEAAYKVANDDYLVTLGIEPTSPSTAYGYIHRGERIGKFDGFEAYKVEGFKEKPHKPLAREFVARGDHDWNSGMFIWKVERILSEIKRQMPDLSQALDTIAAAWDTDRRLNVVREVWPGIKTQTVDYGIMEGAHQVAVLAAEDLGWSDVGSWDSVYDVMEPDENGNIILTAKNIDIDTKSTLVVSESKEKMVVTIGLRDLVIVDSGDALLVCTREEAQNVRQAVNLLKEKGLEKYL